MVRFDALLTPTNAFSASPVSCKWAWYVPSSPAAAGVVCVSQSGETNQVINDVMKSWNYLQGVTESCGTCLLKSEQQGSELLTKIMSYLDPKSDVEVN